MRGSRLRLQGFENQRFSGMYPVWAGLKGSESGSARECARRNLDPEPSKLQKPDASKAQAPFR